MYFLGVGMLCGCADAFPNYFRIKGEDKNLNACNNLECFSLVGLSSQILVFVDKAKNLP